MKNSIGLVRQDAAIKFCRITLRKAGPKSRRHSRFFALPGSWLQRIALFLRGWRPADLPYTAVPWWVNPKLPKDW